MICARESKTKSLKMYKKNVLCQSSGKFSLPTRRLGHVFLSSKTYFINISMGGGACNIHLYTWILQHIAKFLYKVTMDSPMLILKLQSVVLLYNMLSPQNSLQ